MPRFVLPALLAVLACVSAVVPAQSQERHALVIGINDYANVKPLRFAVNDATSVHGVLTTSLGFGTDNADLQIDKSYAELDGAWKDFLARLQKDGGIGVFYYSGHGIELGGRNFLVAKDAIFKANNAAIVEKSSLDLQSMLKDVSRVQDVRKDVRVIFILDACRENPFKKGTEGSGLAPPKFVSKEVFIMYSAGIGQLAIDGPKTGPTPDNQNSVYVKELLPLLKQQGTPKLALSDMAKALSLRVLNAAQEYRVGGKRHYQTPAYYDQFLVRQTLTGLGITAPRPVFDAEDLKVVDVKSLSDTGEAEGLEAGAIFKECLFCPEMVVLPSQTGVLIGSEKSDPKYQAYESRSDGKQLKVNFESPLAIGRFEVTKGEWNACVQDTRDAIDKEKRRPEWACDDKGFVFGEDGEHFEREPVSGVTWNEARRYVAWLNHKIGASSLKYRLPTETEWEFAARAGSPDRYSFSLPGDTLLAEAKKLCTYANGSDQSIGTVTWLNRRCTDHVGRAGAQAGSFKANKWGLHDMHGNVAEWVQDCWQDSYDKTPTDGTAYEDPICWRRVVRGGSWRSRPAALRSAARNAVPPDVGRATLGFRVVRELK